MRQKISTILSFVLIFGIIIVGFAFKFQKEIPKTPHAFIDGGSTIVSIGGKDLNVKIASSEATLEHGLSDTKELAPDTGMFFVFSKPDNYGFWMKDMNYSLDIIWIDQNNSIVHIEKNLTPETYPKTFYPNQSSIYVLEVPAGFSDENNVNVRDKIELK